MAGVIPDEVGRVLAGFSEVQLAYLFGSETRGEARAGSDVDVAVLSDGPLGLDADGRIRDALAAALRRPVDLVDLATAPPLLLRKILGGGKVVVCRDQGKRARFEMRAIARYLDTRRLRDVQHMYLRKLTEDRRAG